MYVDATINLSSLPKALEEEDFTEDEKKEWIRKSIQDIINAGSKGNEMLQSLHAKLEVIFITNGEYLSLTLAYLTQF